MRREGGARFVRSQAQFSSAMLLGALLCGVILLHLTSCCENRSEVLSTCLEQLAPVLENSSRGLPGSEEELKSSCSAFKTGMRCVDNYSVCLSERKRRLVEEQVSAAKYTFRFLCDDQRFQAEYLKYTGCYSTISADWNACAIKFMQLVKEEHEKKSTEQSRLVELCCAKHGFLLCVQAASRVQCRRQEALFLQRIAETLSSLQVHSPVCRELGNAVCSTAGLRNSSMFCLMLLQLIIGVLRW